MLPMGVKIVASWNESSPAIYRRLEEQQRALAADAASDATREIHLEFAERYRKLAEELEASVGLEASKPAGI
jgi:hypothetical protein